MYEDEIIAEVWKNRDAIAARFNHNLHEIVAELQRRQEHPLSQIADRAKQIAASIKNITAETQSTQRSAGNII
jgi:hypothetical protein